MHFTAIPLQLGFLRHLELLKLKTCSLYHEHLFIQKFKVIRARFLTTFFQPLTSWRLSEAVSVSMLWMLRCCLTTIPVEHGFLWHFDLLKVKTCSLYHENPL